MIIIQPKILGCGLNLSRIIIGVTGMSTVFLKIPNFGSGLAWFHNPIRIYDQPDHENVCFVVHQLITRGI